MALGSSKVAIFNKALNLMGCGRAVSSEDEATSEARTLKRFYGPALVTLLQRYDWNFCRVTSTMAQLSESVPGYLYTYKYPDKCVRVRRILNTELADREWSNDFSIGLSGGSGDKIERVICCNIAAGVMEYTALIDDPTLFPPLFEEALCWNLARMSCWSVSDVSQAMRKDISQQFMAAFADASQADANEQARSSFTYPCDYIDRR